MRSVVVTGSFDKLGSSHVRFLEEASKCRVQYRVLSQESG
jgi:glycerol-3-phosphate cytidylyltransferase-like family protein